MLLRRSLRSDPTVQKSKDSRQIGPILVLYLIGIIIGNVGIPSELLKPAQDILSNAMVPLAIPLMLFSCSYRHNNTKSQILALVTGIIAVASAVLTGYLIFGKHLAEGEKIAGMMAGVYTGGTINLAALQTMLGASNETYILMNSYDLIISFLYLSFVLAIGIKLFRKILPHDINDLDDSTLKTDSYDNSNPYSGLFSKSGLKDTGAGIGITLLICAVAGGIALLCPEGVFMTVFILVLTTLSIGSSFIPKVNNLKYSYDVGMYFIYIFCITVASLANFATIDLSESLNLLGYLAFAVFGALAIQVILARIFRIDADTMLISSVTFINSPPFVPMIAAAMKNKSVLAAGLSIGVIGYAIGNYLGYIIYAALSA